MYDVDLAPGEPPSPETLLAAAQAIAGVEVGELSDDAVRDSLVTLSKVRAAVDAALVDRVAVFEARALHVRDGALTVGSWIAANTRCSRGAASHQVKVARQARDMPLAMAAARSGDLPAESLGHLARARGTSDVTAERFAEQEEQIVAHALRLRADDCGTYARRWTAAADPDAEDRRHREIEARRKVRLSRSWKGHGFLDGLLTPEATAILEQTLESITADLHRWGLSKTADGARLTAGQLRHDAMVEMALRATASSTAVAVQRDAKARAAAERSERADTDQASDDPDGVDPPEDHEARTAAAERPEGGAKPADDRDAETPADDEAPAADPDDDGWDDLDLTDEEVEAFEDADRYLRSEEYAESCRQFDRHPITDPEEQRRVTVIEEARERLRERIRRRCREHRRRQALAPPSGGDPGALWDDDPDPPPWDHDPDTDLDPEATPAPAGSPPADKVAGGLGRPLISVVVDLATLEGRPHAPGQARLCEIVGGGPIPDADLRRHLCDAGISRIITRGRSLPLDVGSVSRTATPAQWRALVAHSPRCEFPGCDAPWQWTQAHHLLDWVIDERTDLDILGLLCHGHHKIVHRDGWHLHRHPHGHLTVTRPDGTTLDP